MKVVNDPIHQHSDGLWYFWDETWTDQIGPYSTRDEAKVGLQQYCKTYLGIDLKLEEL